MGQKALGDTRPSDARRRDPGRNQARSTVPARRSSRSSPGAPLHRDSPGGYEIGLFPGTSFATIIEPPALGPVSVEARLPRSFDEFAAARSIVDEGFEFSDRDVAAFETQSRLLWDLEQAEGAFRTFVAILAGEVIGCAAAVFGAHAVYLGGGATRPDMRSRGAYRALVRARWEIAVERGTPALTVNAEPTSEPILARCGFERVGWIDCLVDKIGA